jgi:fucose 4-O-acetylase-like acetyltransferase
MPRDTDFSTPSHASRSPANPRQTAPESRRDDSLDIAKGFGILLVVLGHSLDGLIASGFLPPYLAWPTLTVFAIYLFHMPLFFVVSGHLASGKHRPAQATLAKLLPTIVYPYFLWSILEGLTLVYLSKYTTSHEPISVLYKILWIPIVPYWFLYALFVCQAAYLVIRRLSHGVQLAIAATAFLIPQFFLGPLSNAHLLILLETVRGFLYFIVGVVSVSQVKQFGRWVAMAATVLFILFAIIDYQSQFSGAIAAPAALPAGIAGIIATLAWSRMWAARGGWLARTVAVWGRYSMSIYVMHIFFTAGTRIALKRLAFVTPQPSAGPALAAIVIEIVAATVAGIALPLAINWVVSKFDLDKWFGLQHMEVS